MHGYFHQCSPFATNRCVRTDTNVSTGFLHRHRRVCNEVWPDISRTPVTTGQSGKSPAPARERARSTTSSDTTAGPQPMQRLISSIYSQKCSPPQQPTESQSVPQYESPLRKGPGPMYAGHSSTPFPRQALLHRPANRLQGTHSWVVASPLSLGAQSRRGQVVPVSPRQTKSLATLPLAL